MHLNIRDTLSLADKICKDLLSSSSQEGELCML